jgi:ferredoxin
MRDPVTLDLAAVTAAVGWLRTQGYRPVGPVVLDGTIGYRDLDDDWRPPVGWTLEQAPGSARLVRRDDEAAFGWVPGADSWKQYFYPPSSEVFRATLTEHGWTLASPRPPERPLALVGARACELRALDVLDRVFLDAEHPDPRYAARRRDLFVLAVDCAEPGGTCACVSAGGGPRAEAGFDVRLSELASGGRFVAVAGSDRGAELLDAVGAVPATGADVAAADRRAVEAARHMGRALPDVDLPTALAAAAEHPQWDDVAARCLACGSCTLVCPTCFCGSFADHTGPGGGLAEGEIVRRQEWASCFQADHSRLGPGIVHSTTRARYRQWLTHKLGTWHAQFGVSGCVGCGRCITWCPVGIDLTAEAAALVRPVEVADAR